RVNVTPTPILSRPTGPAVSRPRARLLPQIPNQAEAARRGLGVTQHSLQPLVLASRFLKPVDLAAQLLVLRFEAAILILDAAERHILSPSAGDAVPGAGQSALPRRARRQPHPSPPRGLP